MEINRYLNGVTVSEKELKKVKVLTPEIEKAVNEVRRRAEVIGAISAVKPERSDG